MSAVVLLALLSGSFGEGWVATSSSGLESGGWVETSSTSSVSEAGFLEQIEHEDWDKESERKPNFIEAIEIVGNGKTNDDVILRRLSVAVNDLVDDDLIDQSRLRLLSTGYFKSVEFSLKRGTRRGRVVLLIEVEERNTITIDGLYLGFSDVVPIYGGIGVTESNFLGRGMSVGAGVVAGKDRRALEIGLFVPDLSNTRLQLTVSGIFVEAAEVLSPDDPTGLQLKYSRIGGLLGLGLRVGAAQRVSLDYRLESIQAARLPNLDPAVLRSAPSIQFDQSILSTLSLTYERDTRDDPFVPTEGARAALAVELGTKVFASTYEFSKYTADFEFAFSPFLKHSLVLKAFGGLIQGQTPFFNQFFVRDFMHFALGTKALPRLVQVNFSSFNDYDDLILSGGAEYAIPFAEGNDVLYRAFLYAGVNVAATASLAEIQEDPSGRGPTGRLPISFDLGVKLDTYIGHFTLSLAYVVDLVL
ncbi:MAG: BamA/TamA family outer membrane protein [Myxococcota bacterium]